MKFALLLSGISLEINKHWQYGTLYSVDYNNSYENYQKYIFEYFTNKGYDIDVYISTNVLYSEYIKLFEYSNNTQWRPNKHIKYSKLSFVR